MNVVTILNLNWHFGEEKTAQNKSIDLGSLDWVNTPSDEKQRIVLNYFNQEIILNGNFERKGNPVLNVTTERALKIGNEYFKLESIDREID